MSQKYLLIPLDSIKECDDNEYYHLSWIKSRGEIVQSESIGGFIHKTGLIFNLIKSDIFEKAYLTFYRSKRLELLLEL